MSILKAICEQCNIHQVAYFCIQKQCVKRRLCPDCQREHKSNYQIKELGHSKSLNAFNLLKNHNQGEKLWQAITTTHDRLKKSQGKILDIIFQAQEQFKKQFKNIVLTPLQLIERTKQDYQKEMKQLIYDPKTDKHQLSEIASKFRYLDSKHLSRSDWIKEMSQQLDKQFSLLTTQLAKNILSFQSKMKEMEGLNIFSPKFQDSINENLHAKELQINKDEQMTVWLKNHSTAFVGWDSQMSIKQYSSRNWIKNIEELVLNSNLLIIPKQLHYFSKLKKLDLSKNKIQKIENLNQLINIEDLYLSQNSIVNIQGLDNLTQIKQLALQQNKIEKIQGVSKLITLQHLWLWGNQIKTIQGLETLINLKGLYLHKNQIEILQNVNNLVNLKQLHLYSNPLLDKPEELQKIQELKSKNNIKIRVSKFSWK